MNVKEKIATIQNSEGFLRAMEGIDTPEQMQELFKKHGVELTEEEFSELVKTACVNTEELTVDALDDVSGGGVVGWVFEQVCTWFAKKGLDWLASRKK